MASPERNDPLDEFLDEEVPGTSSSDRRLWARRNPRDGTSLLVLKVFGILYDAGEPLSRADLADRMLAQLDPYAINYLKAWYVRRCEQQHRKDLLRGTTHNSTFLMRNRKVELVAIKTWLTQVFTLRATKGQTLIKDAEGKFSPGPVVPKVVTIDGRRLSFTPTVRQELAQEEHNVGRGDQAVMDWENAIKNPEFASPAIRLQLLAFLGRQFFEQNIRLDERQMRKLFKHLLIVADTTAIKRRLLQRAFDDVLASLEG